MARSAARICASRKGPRALVVTVRFDPAGGRPHQVRASGGFGSAVSETLVEAGVSAGRLFHMGIPDRFLEHASRAAVLEHAGLSPAQIEAKVRELLSAA